MYKNNKKKYILPVLIIIAITVFIFINYQKGDGVLRKATNEEINNVLTDDWNEFYYEDFGYTFKYPKGWLVSRSHEYNEESNLRSGEKKQTLSLSIGEYYFYIFPEGAFEHAIQDFTNPIKSYNTKYKDYEVLVEHYDAENIFINFLDYHDFRIQIFIPEANKEMWATMENILNFMDINNK